MAHSGIADGLLLRPVAVVRGYAASAGLSAIPSAFPVLFDSAASGSLAAVEPLLDPGRLSAGCRCGRTRAAACMPRGMPLPASGRLPGCARSRRVATAPTRGRRRRRCRRRTSPGCGPFRGGWVVFLGYELAPEIEPQLRLPAPRVRP